MLRKILVADDEGGVRGVVRKALARGPYRVLGASDGLQAVRLASEEEPDLILLDLNMPGLSGWEVLRLLRRGAATRLIPVIMLTGEGAVDLRVEGLAQGADDYVTKPFHPAELAARVEGLLRRHARDVSANPLTGLPGTAVLEEEAARRLAAKSPLALLYADIDRFKAYNDAYGPRRGDEVIRGLAALLRDVLARLGGTADLLAHVGGDDFLILTEPARAEALAREIAARFDREAPLYYSAEDRERGGVLAAGRSGTRGLTALMSVSVAVATDERRSLRDYAQAAQVAAQVKAFLKARPGASSAFMKDRRSDEPEACPAPPRPGPRAPRA